MATTREHLESIIVLAQRALDCIDAKSGNHDRAFLNCVDDLMVDGERIQEGSDYAARYEAVDIADSERRRNAQRGI